MIHRYVSSDSSDERDSDSNTSSDPEAAIPAPIDPETSEPITYEDISLTSIQEVATYIVVDAKDRLELTLTPHSIQILQKLFNSLTNPNWTPKQSSHSHVIHNDLGAQTKVELRDSEDQVICASKCDEEGMESNTSSTETSPTRNHQSVRKKSSLDVDVALSFQKYTTAKLYKKLTNSKLHVSIHQLAELTLTCPSRTTTKLVRLHPTLRGQVYHAVVDVRIDASLRSINVRSPLQVSTFHSQIGTKGSIVLRGISVRQITPELILLRETYYSGDLLLRETYYSGIFFFRLKIQHLTS